jgi:hypothetical protein
MGRSYFAQLTEIVSDVASECLNAPPANERKPVPYRCGECIGCRAEKLMDRIQRHALRVQRATRPARRRARHRS